MIKLYPILLFTLFFFFGVAQQEKDTVSLPEDKTQVLETRSFHGDLNERYTGDAFNYDVRDGEAQNLLARFLNWVFKGLRDTFGINIPPNILKILEYLIYVLMGALVIYLLVKFLAGEKLSSIFTKKATSIIDINLSEEHIENVDLDALVQLALEQKNYRLAIRYQYLKALKILSQHNMIQWHYEKTNVDYQKEITAPKMNSLFREVSYLYDYIWYGEQQIDETTYKAANARFVALKNQIPQ